jgi:hypothetical protein
MPSSSKSELSRPHIGSGGGGGISVTGMPESQWPAALSTQQAIAFVVPEEALEICTSVAKNDKATMKHKMPLKNPLRILCLFMTIYWACLGGDICFRTSFILHFRQMPRDFEVTSSCIGHT